jgi:hypothetical protein
MSWPNWPIRGVLANFSLPRTAGKLESHLQSCAGYESLHGHCGTQCTAPASPETDGYEHCSLRRVTFPAVVVVNRRDLEDAFTIRNDNSDAYPLRPLWQDPLRFLPCLREGMTVS